MEGSKAAARGGTHVIRARGHCILVLGVAMQMKVDQKGVESATGCQRQRHVCHPRVAERVHVITLPIKREELQRRPESTPLVLAEELHLAAVVRVLALAEACIGVEELELIQITS